MLVEIAEKIRALDLWKIAAPWTWAIKPRGVAFPYFPTFRPNPQEGANEIGFLEGWDNFYNYAIARRDPSFGFYTSPVELPQWLFVSKKPRIEVDPVTKEPDPIAATPFLFMHCDPGYMPKTVFSKREEEIFAKLLWETYGMMLRLDSGEEMMRKYADGGALFSRVEMPDGSWTDQPMEIMQPRAHVEKITISKDSVNKAKELPFDDAEKLAVDFRPVPNLHTKEARQRIAYILGIIDAATGRSIAFEIFAVDRETSLRTLWQNIAQRTLDQLVRRGKVPGEMQVASQRLFRMLRPLTSALPLKLSLHDSIPALHAAYMEFLNNTRLPPAGQTPGWQT